MKLLVAMCLLAAGVSAQWGESGVVHADGRLQQFTPEEAANIADIGEAGVVMKDGTHVQFDQNTAFHFAGIAPAPVPVAVMLEATGPYGYSGIVKPDGKNVQFTAAEAENVVLVGPSGVVRADGTNLQLDQEGLPVRKKRDTYGAVVGPSGLITPGGKLVQLPPGVSVVSAGPSAALLSDGTGYQYDRKKRETYGAVAGASGLITPDGRLIQLPPGVSVLLTGPSAAILSDGTSYQYSRKKRAAPAKSKATVGESGIITPGGRLIQLPHGVHIVLEGPSAALLSNGDYVQYEF